MREEETLGAPGGRPFSQTLASYPVEPDGLFSTENVLYVVCGVRCVVCGDVVVCWYCGVVIRGCVSVVV